MTTATTTTTTTVKGSTLPFYVVKEFMYNQETNQHGGTTTSINVLETLRAVGRENVRMEFFVPCKGDVVISVKRQGYACRYDSVLECSWKQPESANWEILKIALEKRLINIGENYSKAYKILPNIFDGCAYSIWNNIYYSKILQDGINFSLYKTRSFCGLYDVILLEDKEGNYLPVKKIKK